MINVYVMFNGAAMDYVFEDTMDEFMSKWYSQISVVGYFTGEDVKGKRVVINPSHCGTIDIEEGAN